MDLFRVRLNCIDHYQAHGTEYDPPLFGSHGSTQDRDAPRVPVIRIFGSTETGQKVCAHVHGALPYLFIQYHGSLEKDAVDAYTYQLRLSIDHALAVSYNVRERYSSKVRYVGLITLVKGVPFFGYHVGYRFFLKIYLLNPANMMRFADLLYQGAIMNKILQPFESHLQFLMQWMCDFNLYGCAYVDCSVVRFRQPVPTNLDLESSEHKWHSQSIPEDWLSDADLFPRQSHCSIEVDVCVKDIVNREQVQLRDLHADFVERFGPLNIDEKLVHSLAGLWKDETRRRKLRMGITDPSSSPFPPEVLVSMSADPRNTENGGWIHEDEYRNLVKGLVREESRNDDHAVASFDDFIKPVARQEFIKTVLESVTDLFPENLCQEASFHPSEHEKYESLRPCGDGSESALDEIGTSKFNGEDFPYESEEELAYSAAAPRLKITDEIRENEGAPTMDDIDSITSRGKQINKDIPLHEYKQEGMDGLLYQSDREPAAAPRIEHISHSHAKRAWGDIEEISGMRPSNVHPPDVQQPSKRPRLVEESLDEHFVNRDYSPADLNDAPNDEQRPRSRHVTFQETEPVRAKSVMQRSPSPQKLSSTPSSRQLSQTSIMAHGLHSTSSFSFPVVKIPHSSQGYDTSKETEKTSASQQSPCTPRQHLSPAFTMQTTAETALSNMKSATTTSPVSPLTQTQLPIVTVANELRDSFNISSGRNMFCFGQASPSADDIANTIADYGAPPVIYQDAYYSKEKDVPDRARDYGGREFKLECNTLPYLPTFDPTGLSPASRGVKTPIVIDFAKQELHFYRQRQTCNLRNWQITTVPPTSTEVATWFEQESKRIDLDDCGMDKNAPLDEQDRNMKKAGLSQIDGPTQKNKHGFKYSQKQESTSVRHETQYMSTMAVEIHVNSRENLAPNPEHDEVVCIIWCLKSDGNETGTDCDHHGRRFGILVLCDQDDIAQKISNETGLAVDSESNELDLFYHFVDIVRNFDPDVLTGYEVHNGSWGYMIERSRIKYEYNLCDEFSRMKSQSHGRFGKDADRWGFDHTSTITVTGRHTINIWRAMRAELNLLQYTMENVVFHTLHKRIPHYSFRDLTNWYRSNKSKDVAKCIQYFVNRVQLDLEILDATEIIPRTSEQARLIGVDFFSVFSRGSQFKVESFMFRIAKPENFILVSPSRKQVGQQNALECLPLVMEPQSAFYNSPLLVLDFQSLYPSIMIAYNYCYSTCLGRIVSWRGQNKMGFADFQRQPGLLELVSKSINIAPNGIMYVKPEMRKSLLAKMLSEVLETRVMVKSGMKVDKQDKTLQQLLNNRQLALKFLANVTYGYTSASFSGRMPCSEIADSIVQTARETLEKSIAFIHSVERWGAEVVYGDTDSLFVYLKGRTRDEAFDIGKEIADEITNRNPRPMKLKFEKVYHPCVLLAKKRYVGFKYESKGQVEPEFDAKGIETVRRDGTPAEQKIEEKALKILFRTADLSQVKNYFQQQCTKIMLGKVSIQDFCFAKEVRLGSYADKGPPPPGALISTRRMLVDPRTEPQYGERVPYVVITGAPGARLIDRCVAPEQLLKDEGLELDAEYYISKNLIPPLERIFNLVGANVRQWYDEMPKVQRIRDLNSIPTVQTYMPNGAVVATRKTLESYMKSSHCVVCRTKLPPLPKKAERDPTHHTLIPLCQPCLAKGSTSLYNLTRRLCKAENKVAQLSSICRSCAGLSWSEEVKCDSKDCPVFYSRVRLRAKESTMRSIFDSVGEVLHRDSLDW